MLAWIGFGFALSWRLLRVVPGTVSGIHRYLFPPLFLFLMIVYPGSEFAQREHLMIVATLPYLLLAQARLEGRETDAASCSPPRCSPASHSRSSRTSC